jgi:RNA polymerase sigma-70 factor, ECF subfamily
VKSPSSLAAESPSPVATPQVSAGELRQAFPPDEFLVSLSIGGDEDAFGNLVARHRSAAVRVATAIVGRDRAEDVVQDALLLAFKALPSMRDRSKFFGWFAAITRFRALRLGHSESRRLSRHISLDNSLLETLSELACGPRTSEEGDDILLSALDRIPPEYSEVIRLHFLHDVPHQKIAEFLDVPITTVKWRCFRGKELLRDAVSTGPEVRTRCSKVSCSGARPLGFVVREDEDPCPSCPSRSAAACGTPLPAARRRAARGSCASSKYEIRQSRDGAHRSYLTSPEAPVTS